MRAFSAKLLPLILVAVTACAPARPTGSDSSAQPSTPAQPQRTLTILVKVEPIASTTNIDLSGGVNQAIVGRLFGAGLTQEDHLTTPIPYLAEALPALNTDTWKVSSDGTMQVTYRLRPNLTWHDGTPLSVQDFVFANKIYKDPGSNTQFDNARTRDITAIETPDDRTLVMSWRRPTIEAGQLTGGKGGFTAMPRHILEETFNAEPARLVGHSYFTTSYVGLGPYKLDRWEPGAFIEGTAFEGHALGKAKIDKVKVIWNGDSNVALATMLGGNADLAGDDALRFQQGTLLKKEWGDGRGQILFNTTSVRYTQMQFRPEVVNPKAMLDLRVRKALAHTIDKQGFVDALLDGQGYTADMLVSRDRAFYADLDKTITKYPYDVRRAEQYMTEAGLVKGSDGFFAMGGEQFAPELRGEQQNELVILADGWKRAGMNAQLSVTPASLATDNEYRSFLPAMAVTKSSVPDRTLNSKYATETVAAPENRYGGTNKGGYSNPDYDKLYTAFNSTLDRGEANKLTMEIARFASENLPGLPLYYDLQVTAHISALKGPLGDNFWNIQEWTWS
jgi:peptide/nickel transport system substrate-binding protein